MGGADARGVLLVPNAALRFRPANAGNQKRGGGHPGGFANGGAAKPKQDGFSGKIYVLEQGELAPVSVSQGITDNRNTEITGGELKEGDQAAVGEVQASSNPHAGPSPMRMRF